MPKKRLPWDKWSWDAWRGDPRLAACSLAARGLWIEMLGIMREGDPVGYLKVGSKVILEGYLPRLTRSSPEECSAAFAELEECGVFSRDPDTGVIFSRRMVRDEELRQKRAEGGRKGGNPALMRKTKDNPKDNLKDNRKVTLKSLELRVQKKNPPSADPPDGGTPPSPPPKRNPQAAKVKRLEDYYREQGAKPPKPSVLSTWMSQLGGVENALLFLADMHGKNKLGQHSFCWECSKDWQPRRGGNGKPVQGKAAERSMDEMMEASGYRRNRV